MAGLARRIVASEFTLVHVSARIASCYCRAAPPLLQVVVENLGRNAASYTLAAVCYALPLLVIVLAASTTSEDADRNLFRWLLCESPTVRAPRAARALWHRRRGLVLARARRHPHSGGTAPPLERDRAACQGASRNCWLRG